MTTLRQIIDSLDPTKQNHANDSQVSIVANNVTPLTDKALIPYRQLKEHTAILDTQFANFVLDSRKLTSQDAFVLLKSQTQSIDKSRSYLQQAQSQAKFILTEIPLNELQSRNELQASEGNENSDQLDNRCPIIEVEDIRSILGSLIQANLAFSQLSKKVSKQLSKQVAKQTALSLQPLPKVIAVTGTNGKTTISQLVAQLCQSSDSAQSSPAASRPHYTTAIMGTAGNGKLGQLVQASHTTGDALAVQTFVQQMAEDNVDILALEASSHGLDQQRLQGVPVKVAIYTNLSRDHLDYHPNMDDYARAKARLFDRAYFPTLTHAVINIDDAYAPLMLQVAADSGIEVWTYSIDVANVNKLATFKAQQVVPSMDGVQIELVTDFGTVWLTSPLLGRFNVANLLGAIAGSMAVGISLEEIPNLVTQLQGADGRMERVSASTLPTTTLPKTTNNKQPKDTARGTFIVDYAHTPDALTQVLTSLQPHCEGELWAVFGCGGDRDRGKRPLMAQAGFMNADKVILTSDNPRSEDPEQILQDMSAGIFDNGDDRGSTDDKGSINDIDNAQQSKVQIIADRREAIAYATTNASAKDIVVIAGKGHETYQEINGVRHDFDDRQVLRQALAKQS